MKHLKIPIIISLFFILISFNIYAGDLTITVTGNETILINVAGTTQNEEAGNFNVKVYYKNADLSLSDVDASQLVTVFGWGTTFETKIINTGTFNENSTTYTHELIYGNVDLGSQDDIWPTSGVVALSITFTNGSSGEAYVFIENDGLANYSGSAHTFTLNGSTVTPLPVELTSFSANSIEGTKAQLKWETATEVNNYGFDVERRVKTETEVGKQESAELSWEKVGFVEGHGNSNSPKLYSFTDKNLVGGSKFMYRLKQLDIDGTYKYSDEVEVEVLPTKYELFQNYPNPFNPTTNIKFSLPEDAKVAINIYNVLGEKVGQLLNEDLKAGFHQVEFSTNSVGYRLASGVYLYTIESKNFSQVKKMILMK